MFTQLESLLKNCSSVNLILSANKDGTLSVTVLPKPKETGDDVAALSTPLSLTATAEELDAEFAGIMSQYVGTHQSLAEQMENTKAILEAAKQESQKKATTAISKSSTTSKASKPTPSESTESEDGDGDDDSGNDEGDQSDDTGTTQVESSETAVAAKADDNLWG